MHKDASGNVWHPGLNVWIPHKDVAYAPGTVLENLGGGKLKVKNDEDDQVEVIDSSQLETINSDLTQDYKIDDLTKLPDLHRPALLHALNARFDRGLIYTYTGLILIAVNPFKDLNLYGKKKMAPYMNSQLGDVLPPHAYASANRAFLSMIEKDGRNQSILVSGESGAGKTVTTKIVMDYLTKISERGSGSSGTGDICERVLQTNPLLESLGNAMTRRNDNSSRFGKLIKLQFEEGKSRLMGAQIDTYLLEKARVIRQGPGERNFHIFYELIAGATAQQKRDWNLELCEESRLLCNEDVQRSDVGDLEQFKKTIKAMDVVGLSKEERDRIFRVVMAVLHLGDVTFVESARKAGEEGSKLSPESQESVDSLCKLLQVDSSLLEKALCSRFISARGQGVLKLHTVQQAEEARDALAMGLYERLFLWTVWRVNESVKTVNLTNANKRTRKKNGFNHMNTISCLDIFGFEVFDSNSFEQLCINYANEVLQQIFNKYVFEIEQKFYEAEGINWKVIAFPDNYQTIDMIEGPSGVLKLVDEECLTPKGSDRGLHQKFYNNVRSKYKTLLIDDDTQKGHQLFSIKHFAGEVEYSTSGFCAKNKNELRQEQIEFIRSSKDSTIQILLPPDAANASGAASGDYFTKISKESSKKSRKKSTPAAPSGHKTQKLQQRTVGAYFKDQLHEAVDFLSASEPHFIRTIKPNDYNVADEMDRIRTVEQLNYSGVLEAVRIARQGYSSRFQLQEFAIRFRCLTTGSIPTSSKNKAFKPVCLSILKNAGLIEFDDYQVGHTRVFLRTDGYGKLEGKKRETLYGSAALLQKNIRIFLLKCLLYRRAQEKEAIRRKKAGLSAPTPKPPPRKKPKKPEPEPVYESEESEDEVEVEKPQRTTANKAQPFDLSSIDVDAIKEYLTEGVQKLMQSTDQESFQKLLSDDPLILAIPFAVLILLFDPRMFYNILLIGAVGGFGFLVLQNQQKANGGAKPLKKSKGKNKTKKKTKKNKKFRKGKTKKKASSGDDDDYNEKEERMIQKARKKRQTRRLSRGYGSQKYSGMSLKRTKSGRILVPEN